MSLKDDSEYYTFTYIASSTKGGEEILSYTTEELDEKGIDSEELVESIQAGEKFDGYFWRRTRTAIKCGEQGVSCEKDSELSEDYVKQLEKVRNTKIVNGRKEEKIYEDRFLKDLKGTAVSFCEENNFSIGVRLSKKGNLCLWKGNDCLITYYFPKNDNSQTKTLLGVFRDKEVYEQYRLWEIFQVFQNEKGSLSYDGRSIIFSPYQSQNSWKSEPKKKNKKFSKGRTMRRNNIENTR